jgi:hypothetical protein
MADSSNLTVIFNYCKIERMGPINKRLHLSLEVLTKSHEKGNNGWLIY